MAAKAPITCHILDTSRGRPAPSVPVTLTPSYSPTTTFSATTDTDGRIKLWDAPLDAILSAAPEERTRWTLRFDTESYFGKGKSFFPEVVVVFEAVRGESYHVPVLLSPFGYSTYRGS